MRTNAVKLKKLFFGSYVIFLISTSEILLKSLAMKFLCASSTTGCPFSTWVIDVRFLILAIVALLIACISFIVLIYNYGLKYALTQVFRILILAIFVNAVLILFEYLGLGFLASVLWADDNSKRYFTNAPLQVLMPIIIIVIVGIVSSLVIYFRPHQYKTK